MRKTIFLSPIVVSFPSSVVTHLSHYAITSCDCTIECYESVT